ncbi:MAG: hypothetical protein IPL51_10070 [Candidatus Competibacteraceae bacterium]|nr:hypothetical protein [Candidatus Competibacteraceae bacterium]
MVALYTGLGILDAFDIVQVSGPGAPWNAAATVYDWQDDTLYPASTLPSYQGGQVVAYSLSVKPGKQIADFTALSLRASAGSRFGFSVNGGGTQYEGPGAVLASFSVLPETLMIELNNYGDPVALYLNPEARLIDAAPNGARWAQFLRAEEV